MLENLFSGRIISVVYITNDTVSLEVVKVYEDCIKGRIIDPNAEEGEEAVEVLIPFTAILTIILDETFGY